MKKNNFLKFISFFIVLFIFVLTIGFSAFQEELLVSDIETVVRIRKDIRVTGISVASSFGNASSYWEEYNVHNIYSGINLPNDSSSVTYEVDVTNIGNAEMGIFDISGLPDGLTYSISGYNIKDKLCDSVTPSKCSLGAVTSFLLTISYDEDSGIANTHEYNLDIDFDFRRIYSITYDGFSNVSNLPNSIMDGDSKIIAFDSNSGIPSEVLVDGATYSYNSPNLNLSNPVKNVTVYKKYTITYVLDGGIQAQGQTTMIASCESITLLDPSKDEFNFGGWFNNSDLEGEPITVLENVTQDITLYAYWTEYDYFVKHADFDGTVGNLIDTGICLYSSENVNKNFRIKFTIDSFDDSYPTTTIQKNSAPTILSSMLETGSPWPGFVFRLFNSNGTKYNIKINDSHVTSFDGYYPLVSGINVEIVRENGVMYTKVNSQNYTEVLVYESIINTFDTPLTIGGNINANGQYDRLFKGSLSDVSVEFYEGELINTGGSGGGSPYTEVRTETSYQLNGTIEFDGTNYIDTGINLFSSANINKDFEISFTLNQVGGNVAQATLMNLKDEGQSNVWPGVAYRIKSGTNFEFSARWPGQTNVSLEETATVPKFVKLARRNGIIYYAINNNAEAKLISVPPASLTKSFSSNLTFGASLNGSLNPFRFFTGIVSDINVELFD